VIDRGQTPSHLECNITLSRPVRNDNLALVKGGEFFFIAEYLSPSQKNCLWYGYFSKSFSRYVEASYFHAYPDMLQMFESRLNKDNNGKCTIVKI